MEAVEKLGRAYQRDKENRVRQEVQPGNQFRRVMPFIEFVARRNKLGVGKKRRVTKAVSEEIEGSFDNQTISDAIYAYFASDADVAEKQDRNNEPCCKNYRHEPIWRCDFVGGIHPIIGNHHHQLS